MIYSWSEEHRKEIKPGVIVNFEGGLIGMVVKVYSDGNTIDIMQPSGRIRKNRAIILEENQIKIDVHDRREAPYLHSAAWDHWKKENLNEL